MPNDLSGQGQAVMMSSCISQSQKIQLPKERCRDSSVVRCLEMMIRSSIYTSLVLNKFMMNPATSQFTRKLEIGLFRSSIVSMYYITSFPNAFHVHHGDCHRDRIHDRVRPRKSYAASDTEPSNRATFSSFSTDPVTVVWTTKSVGGLYMKR